MLRYARDDTHFLLFIYDNMRNELIKSSDLSTPNGDLVFEVLDRSKRESLQRYEHPVYDAENGQGPNGWYNLLFRNPGQFNREQFAVFRAVHQWRDKIARIADEGTNTVIPRFTLFKIAGMMPTTMSVLHNCLQRSSHAAHTRTGELLELIKEAKSAGATGPVFMELFQTVQKNRELRKKSLLPAEDRHHNTTVVNLTRPAVQAPPQSNILFITKISQFWGSTLQTTNSVQHRDDMQRQRENIRLAIPLPPLTAEVFESAKSPLEALKPQSNPGAQAEIQYVKERKPKESEVFVVREVGGSRKRKLDDETPMAIIPEMPTKPTIRGEDSRKRKSDDNDLQEEVPSVPVLHTGVSRLKDDGADDLTESTQEVEDDEEEEKDQEKQAKIDAKRAKKQRKKARKLDQTREELQDRLHSGGINGEPAFDYVNAPSLLHPKVENPRKDTCKKKRPFDPYAKASNAPEGKRRRKQETGARSVTFAR